MNFTNTLCPTTDSQWHKRCNSNNTLNTFKLFLCLRDLVLPTPFDAFTSITRLLLFNKELSFTFVCVYVCRQKIKLPEWVLCKNSCRNVVSFSCFSHSLIVHLTVSDVDKITSNAMQSAQNFFDLLIISNDVNLQWIRRLYGFHPTTQRNCRFAIIIKSIPSQHSCLLFVCYNRNLFERIFKPLYIKRIQLK